MKSVARPGLRGPGLSLLATGACLLLAAPFAWAQQGSAGSLPESIPVQRETSGQVQGFDGGWLFPVIALLLLVAAIVIAVRGKKLRARHATATTGTTGHASGPWWTRVRGLLDATPSQAIERVSSTRLTPRHSLHVVVWEGRRLLLGCSEQSIQVLAESKADESAAETRS